MVVDLLFKEEQLPEEAYRQLFEKYLGGLTDEVDFIPLQHRETNPGLSMRAVINGLAKNPYTPPDILEEISHTHNQDVAARFICTNPNTSVETLERMSLDPNWLYFMMLNPKLPLSILKKGANSSDADIRALAAGSSKVTLELLTDLSFDGEYKVRDAVYQNPLTPQELKDRMDEDDD